MKLVGNIVRLCCMGWVLAHGRIAVAESTDAPSPASSKLTIGGYIETYFQLNLRAPSNHLTNLRAFDSRDRSFSISNVALDANAERGPLTAHLILQIGSTPTAYYGAEQEWKYIQQATVAYAAGDAVFDAGLVPSPIGLEVIPVKDNWNWSRSDLFFGLPAYHTGVRAAYKLGGGWTGMLHIYNGWNSVVDNNAYPSAGLSASYTSTRVSAQILYFGGVERATGAPEGQPWRHLLDAYATVALSDQVSVAAQADAGIEPNDIGTSGWMAGAVYGKVQLTPSLYAAARGDYFREYVAESSGAQAAPIFWPTPWIASTTATLAVQPVDGLSVRFELRHDQAKQRVFFGGDVIGDGDTMPYVPNRRAQDTFTIGAVAWF